MRPKRRYSKKAMKMIEEGIEQAKERKLVNAREDYFKYVSPDRRPERIPAIMGELQALWQKFPEMRLGQLLLNSMGTDDLFYLEDKDLLQKVREFARKISQ